MHRLLHDQPDSEKLLVSFLMVLFESVGSQSQPSGVQLNVLSTTLPPQRHLPRPQVGTRDLDEVGKEQM